MSIITGMRWVMLVAGVLTATMVYAFVDPAASMQSNFGEPLDGAAARLVVRNWGALIALVGGMLIYGAFNVAVRPLVLVVAGVSKAIFIGLVLSHGSRYLPTAGIPVVVDSLMVLLFAWYLVVAPSAAQARPSAIDSRVQSV